MKEIHPNIHIKVRPDILYRSIRGIFVLATIAVLLAACGKAGEAGKTHLAGSAEGAWKLARQADFGIQTESLDLNAYETVLYVSESPEEGPHDTEQPSAENSGEGSKSSPFSSIAKAVEHAFTVTRPDQRTAILVSEGHYPVINLQLYPEGASGNRRRAMQLA